ncbi:dynein light chain roadblock-type 2-like [Anopheles ziemanni]|uniref:dynein light chain roadblock-type 2-like n=1 Tax=Anopheles coustani TaxID=139045 RepID=UPI0026587305|nr:dynein light chain roadblock-type 2-like [Anopheles coustani]XP_058169141.1 dynein light chain roadblock-type 2-like [Anopheles ziemanni]
MHEKPPSVPPPEPEPEPEDLHEKYIDHCFELIRNVRLVKQVIVMNDQGHPVRSTISDERESVVTAGLYASLKDKACYYLKALDPEDEFLMLRIKTRNNEAIVSTDPEHGLLYITVQVPK